MTKIEKIWQELESDQSVSSGLVIRRYSGTVLPDVFVALRQPHKYRGIAASFPKSFPVNLLSFSNLRDIDLQLASDEKHPDKNILLLSLLNVQHTDIFAVLCEDLMHAISHIDDQAELLAELLNRFEKWKSLFDKVMSEGLTREEQCGLYGELLFLKKCIERQLEPVAVITSWTGCEGQIRDFQLHSWSVEVKTTYGNNQDRVQINGERQLDTSNLDKLFLYHVSVEARQNDGESLNLMVASISELLKDNFIALKRFQSKLLSGGYFDRHKDLYAGIGYFLRRDIFYVVTGDFPRIEQKDLRAGVGDVKYFITLAGRQGFVKSEQEVFQEIRFV